MIGTYNTNNDQIYLKIKIVCHACIRRKLSFKTLIKSCFIYKIYNHNVYYKYIHIIQGAPPLFFDFPNKIDIKIDRSRWDTLYKTIHVKYLYVGTICRLKQVRMKQKRI